MKNLLSSLCGADRIMLCFFFTSSTLVWILSIISRMSSTCKSKTKKKTNAIFYQKKKDGMKRIKQEVKFKLVLRAGCNQILQYILRQWFQQVLKQEILIGFSENLCLNNDVCLYSLKDEEKRLKQFRYKFEVRSFIKKLRK